MNEKIGRTHLERRAVVYLRQSTMKQVHECRESTARQYGLRQRAIDLGWSPDAVQVVDEDLGRSGTSTAGREGFLRLAEDVAHGRVGAIFALEPSRFARSSADWHRLVEICGLTNVLIADEIGVYAPRDPNDRLLLGLKGQMSEAEQYWMRLRLQGGKLTKARRGDLYISPATGYQWDRTTSRLRLDPDEHVQLAVRLVFERFRIDGSACGVVRHFAANGLRVPARRGTGDIVWVTPRRNTVLCMLRNPVYAGAYAFGRRQETLVLLDGETRRRRLTTLPEESWKACLRDHHPAYISWEQFMANKEKLIQNRSNHASPEQRGAAREGKALLQGLVLCGRCGQRMNVRYQGKYGQWQYECRSPRKAGHPHICWSLSGNAVDEAVVALFLRAAQPPEIELAFAVAREAERQAAEIDRQWKLRLERVRYDALLAERRYKAVDPDNRVVARTLERDWEEKLQEVERTEREHADVRRREKVDLNEQDRARILSLARDLPRVWRATSTSHAQRKNLLRILVQEVALVPVDVPRRQTRVKVLWETGAVTEVLVERPSFDVAHTTAPATAERIRQLGLAGRSAREVAAELNRAGLKTGMGRRWDVSAVSSVRITHGFAGPPTSMPRPHQRDDGLFSIAGIATRFDVSPHVVRYWVEKGLIVAKIVGGPGRASWYEIDDEAILRLEAAKANGHGARGRPQADSETNQS
jgi:DNA invertase Pin-like site-specific DNA recombinase